jgi:rhodanese-related sulfurtransferase
MSRRPRLFLLLLTGLAVGCKPLPLAEPALEPPAVSLPQSVKVLNAEQAAAWIQAGPGRTILDVREDWEIRKFGTLPNSVWADFLNKQRFEDAVAKLDRSRPCLVCCAIGGRARQVVARLAAMGFTDLSWLEGGFEAWVQSGRPLTR